MSNQPRGAHPVRVQGFVCAGVLMASSLAHAGGDCSGTTVGLVPLNDLRTDLHSGFQGGLYPNGVNERPAVHEAAGVALAESIQPLNALGNPSLTGRIGFLAVGMSNAVREFDGFIELVNQDPDIHSRLEIVNGAEGGRDAAQVADPFSPYWTATIPTRLTEAGLSPEQVQVVWLKEATASPTDPFPDHAMDLRDLMQDIVTILHDEFPNLKIVYLNSRTYAGYATNPLNPEPYAYEQGFSIKWLIEDQINGDPALNFDPSRGPVRAPWLSWGSYVWADGEHPRSDGTTWSCSDFDTDGTHPSNDGVVQVAGMMLDQFKGDTTSTSWFLEGQPDCETPALVEWHGHGSVGSLGGAEIYSSGPSKLGTPSYRVTAWNMPPNSQGFFVLGSEPLNDGAATIAGASLLTLPSLFLDLDVNVDGEATFEMPTLPVNPALCDVTFYLQYLVLDAGGPEGAVASTPALAIRVGE